MDDIKRIMSHYDLSSDCIKKINTGSSGNVYLIESKGEKYVLKETVANQMKIRKLII